MRPIPFLTIVLVLQALAGCGSIFQAHQQSADGQPYIRVCLADAVQEAELVLEPGAVLQAVGHRYSLEGHSLLRCRLGKGGDMDVLVDGQPARTFSGVFRCYSSRQGGRFGFEGRLYSDTILFASDGRAIYVVNVLPVEEYLKGVVPELIGRNRKPDEAAAVRAQAILARTYARTKIDLPLRRLFDVYSDRRDQVFGGVMAHDALSDEAVERTRGEVLVYEQRYAETFSHSTCGGTTESAARVLEHQEARPYLMGVSDHSPNGDWCRISPSYRWTEEYNRSEFEIMLRRTLPLADARFAGEDIPETGWYLLDLKVLTRMPSGRVEELLLVVGTPSHQRSLHLHGATIRQVIEREEGRPLRSALVDIFLERDADRWIKRVRIQGGGNGHGVGFCQWGAIGRARAGYSEDAILTAYYPGTSVEYDY